MSVASHWEVVVKTQKGLLSIAEGLDFVTNDEHIGSYAVRTIW